MRKFARNWLRKLAQETFGKIFLEVVVSVVGVGLGTSSPGTDCSIFLVWVKTVARIMTLKAKFAKKMFIVVVLQIICGAIAASD